MRRALSALVAGAFFILVAFLVDAAPLFVVGVAFVLLGVFSPAWVWAAARAASIARHPLPGRIVEGEAIETLIELRRGPLGLPGASIVDPLCEQPMLVRTMQTALVARFERRGLHQLEPPSLHLQDPLGIASAAITGAGPPQQLLVLPRTEPIRWSEQAHGQRAEGSRARGASEPLAAVDVEGLRPYRHGTPASRIHWPALARGAGLLERRLQADADERPLIVLDARAEGPSEPLEAAVRAAASLTLELARSGGCRVLLPGARRAVVVEPELMSWPLVHSRLAVLEGGPDAPAPLIGADRAPGGLIYVAARTLERVPTAIAQSGGWSVLVLPAELAAPAAGAVSFEVAACQGFVLGARARRRAA